MRCDCDIQIGCPISMADVLVSFKKITGEVHQLKIDPQDADGRSIPTSPRTPERSTCSQHKFQI